MLVDRFPDRTIKVHGEDYLYFGGTSYLGMATHTGFQQLLVKNLQQWGSFYGSSRNANIKLSVYDAFENHFADFVDAASAVSISSGTLAGNLAVESLYNDYKDFFHYPKTHPAILAPNSQPLFIDNELHPKIKNTEVETIVITSDAILSGEVTPTDYNFLNEIPKSIKVTLIIDESHSLGLIGKNGQGIFATIQHPRIARKILISSLGKALGLTGGVIASDKEFIDHIKQHATFTSSSGASPAYLNTFLQAQTIYREQQAKLKENLKFLKLHLIKKEAYKFNSEYPVIYIDNDRIFEQLLAAKIVITNFKYPTYKKRMNRVVITSNHTQKDIQTLINLLNDK